MPDIRTDVDVTQFRLVFDTPSDGVKASDLPPLFWVLAVSAEVLPLEGGEFGELIQRIREIADGNEEVLREVADWEARYRPEFQIKSLSLNSPLAILGTIKNATAEQLRLVGQFLKRMIFYEQTARKLEIENRGLEEDVEAKKIDNEAKRIQNERLKEQLRSDKIANAERFIKAAKHRDKLTEEEQQLVKQLVAATDTLERSGLKPREVLAPGEDPPTRHITLDE